MSMTISVSSGSISMRHDRRDYKKGQFPKNVDESRTPYNTYFVVSESVRESFNSFFANEVNDYNQKQKRVDRRIDDYYKHIKKSKNGETPIYEYVFQLGNKDDCFVESDNALLSEMILKEYAESFQERNPNFHVISNCLHVDEATPHLHIAFIPFSDGYSQGVSKRCSTSKALSEMGFNGENRNMRGWKRREEEFIEKIMLKRNIKRKKYNSARGRVDVQLYKEIKDRCISENKELFEKNIYYRVEGERAENKYNGLLKENAKIKKNIAQKQFELDALDKNINESIKSLDGLNKELESVQNKVAERKHWLEENPAIQKTEIVNVEKVVEHNIDYKSLFITSMSILKPLGRILRGLSDEFRGIYEKLFKNDFDKPVKDTLKEIKNLEWKYDLMLRKQDQDTVKRETGSIQIKRDKR